MLDDSIYAIAQKLTRIWRMIVIMGVMAVVTGCANRPSDSGPAGVVFVVPGASGDGHSYNALRTRLSRAGFGVRTHRWGAPFFAMNFSNQSIHDKAETALARRIDEVPNNVRVVVVGHSAGGGVALGAVARLEKRSVESVVLLSPSVSPGYDLSGALKRTTGTIHNFFSDRDVTFLKWRTGNFGTYDRIKTPAAGHAGLLTDNPRVVQHRYQDEWRSIGNAGGHWGTLADAFVAQKVVPCAMEK